MQPDIIAMQEAVQSEDLRHDTAQAIQQSLNYFAHTTQSRYKLRVIGGSAPTPSYSNLCTLSHLPCINKQIITLPTVPQDGERHALFCTFDIKGKKILIINIHLTHIQHQSDLRSKQIQKIIQQIENEESYAGIFIVGDFNAAIADVSAYFASHELQIIDTFATENKESDNASDNTITHTLSHGLNTYKIDHIIQLLPAGHKSLPIHDSRIVFHEKDPDLQVKISDHNGLTCQLAL